MLNGSPDIADHPPRHRRMRAIGGLKLGVNEDIFAAQPHPQQTVGLPRLDGELLRVNHFDDFDVVATEGEAGEIVGVVLHQILGNNIKVGHTLPTFRDTHRDVKAGYQHKGRRGWNPATRLFHLGLEPVEIQTGARVALPFAFVRWSDHPLAHLSRITHRHTADLSVLACDRLDDAVRDGPLARSAGCAEGRQPIHRQRRPPVASQKLNRSSSLPA